MSSQGKQTRGFLYKSAIYAIGDLLTKGSRFILIPFYVHAFTESEVGIMAMLIATTVASWTIMSLGFGFGVRRFHVDEEHSADQANQFLSTMFWTRAVAALPLLGILLTAGYYFSTNAGTSIPTSLLLVAIVSGYFRAGINIYESALMAREEAVKYRTFTFLQFTCTTALIIGAVILLGGGLAGAVYAEAVSTCCWCLGVAVSITRKARPAIRTVDWRKILSHCAPAVPHLLFVWGLASSDRLLLEQFGVATENIGVYEVGYMLATTLGVFSMAMRSAWFPSFFRTASQDGAPEKYARMATMYFCVVAAAAMSLMLFSPEFIAIVAPASYVGAVPVMRLVLLGNLFLTVYIACNQPLFFANRTGLIALTSGLGLAVNITANVFLIPRLGITGAAIATIAGYSSMTVAMFFMVQKHFRIPWDYESLALLATAGGVAAWIGLQPEPASVLGVCLRVAVGILFAGFALFVARRSQQRSNLQLALATDSSRVRDD